ncbi:hypothetical protein BpHYR1_035156 [Brachionus plicatilis]|uniref:Ig-like domain-containing protein n=1 Tax=Brachionus plicatilis TaxID=10195 RepID=A0A3M7SDV3_BRAPC|nr:hypothetical protein BpHYR1_035156 [Brachionus plicatilis]
MSLNEEELDEHYDSFLPSWQINENDQKPVSYKVAPHILSFKNFSNENLGSYVCRTKNKNGLLVELGVKFELDEFKKKIRIKNIKEKILDDEIQQEELSSSKKRKIPNIKISFSDKQALANGERVQIFCEADKNAKIEWYRVTPTGELGKLITTGNSIVKSPIYSEDLGRYRCIATNKFGYRSRDAVLTRQNDSVEYFVYGFVDRYSEFSFENSGQALSLYRSKNNKNQLSLKIKKVYDKNNNLKFKCLANFKSASLKWVIPGSHDIIQSSYLLFRNISDQNVGLYECIGNYKNQNAKIIFSVEKHKGSIVTRPHAFIYSLNNNFIRLDFLTNIQDICQNDRIEIACSSKQEILSREILKKNEN